MYITVADITAAQFAALLPTHLLALARNEHASEETRLAAFNRLENQDELIRRYPELHVLKSQSA